MYNVTLGRVVENIVAVKRNTYDIFCVCTLVRGCAARVCVCVRAFVGEQARACACLSVAFLIQHAIRMRHVAICSLSGSATFSANSPKQHDFRGGGGGR
jgi:hypothetical protein